MPIGVEDRDEWGSLFVVAYGAKCMHVGQSPNLSLHFENFEKQGTFAA
jgi:hypothetical protein